MAQVDPGQSWGYAVSTYRYLRLAIVVVVTTLFISLLWERHRATCWQESVSSYYYTPVHAIFIAALAVIGVALITIRGATPWEEALLNLAGFLAPIVAFVPTGWSSSNCPSVKSMANLRDGFQGNNLLAYLSGGALAILLAIVTARIRGKKDKLLPRQKEVVIPALAAGVFVGVGIVWFLAWRGSFDTHAHSYSAIMMFVLVGIVMILTGHREDSALHRRMYYGCAGAMVAGFAVVAIASSLTAWRHKVLVLEAIEATVFVAFWFAQSIELWDQGLDEKSSATI
jgi:hypothetical protein